ncbi:hypothetical protein KAU08_05010, partial [bacterium]|nr:hypothetical protein [bacterium]
MQIKSKAILLLMMSVLSLLLTAGCSGLFSFIPHYLPCLVKEKPSETYEIYEWGQIDVEGINDYLNGISCHYSDGIIVGLGEYRDGTSLNRFGRRFPVIIISSTGDGN